MQPIRIVLVGGSPFPGVRYRHPTGVAPEREVDVESPDDRVGFMPMEQTEVGVRDVPALSVDRRGCVEDYDGASPECVNHWIRTTIRELVGDFEPKAVGQPSVTSDDLVGVRLGAVVARAFEVDFSLSIEKRDSG